MSETLLALKRPSSIRGCFFENVGTTRNVTYFHTRPIHQLGLPRRRRLLTSQVYGFPELVATSVLDNIVSEFRLLFQAISGGANRDAIDAVASAKPSLSLSLCLQLSSSRPRPDWWGRPKPSTDKYFKVWRAWQFLLLPSSHCCQCPPELF